MTASTNNAREFLRSKKPISIKSPVEYAGQNHLALACTQLADPLEQRRLVSEWCELLPTLKNVCYLQFNSRVNQKLFEAACCMPGLQGLYIKWSGVKTLDSVTKLRKIRELHVGNSPQIQSIECLSALTTLEVLTIENLKLIRRLDPIGQLTKLRALEVKGSMWSTQLVETLKPLSKLVQLRHLSIVNLKSDDESLEPLCCLKNLEVLFTATWWPKEQYRILQKAIPRLKL